MRQATTPEELDGCERALLSKRDDPAHVKRASGADKHVKDWREASGYAQWKGMQSRAAAILLTLGDTKEADTPSLDDPDLDFQGERAAEGQRRRS